MSTQTLPATELGNFASLDQRLDSMAATADNISNLTAALEDAKKATKTTHTNLPGGNILDGALDFGSGLAEIVNAQDAKRNKAKKTISGAATTLLGAQQLLIGETLTVAAFTGVATGAAAMACSTVAGLSFAISMWGATAKSLYDAHIADKKTDMEYLAHDRLVKFENVAKKIAETENKLDQETNPKKRAKLTTTIDRLKENNTVLANQAIALTKTHGDTFTGKYKIGDKTVKDYIESNFKVDLTQNKASEPEQKLANHLQQKQTNKFNDSLLSATELGIGAVGLTLLAISPAVSAIPVVGQVLGPALGVAGITCTLASAAAGIYHLADNLFANRLRTKSALKAEQKNIVADFDLSLLDKENIPRFKDKKPISNDERIKLYYAYKNSNFEDSQQFLASLNNTPKKEVTKFINTAFDQVAKDHIVANKLKLPKGTNVDEILSRKDQNKTFKQYAKDNHGLLSAASASLMGFFKPAAKKEKDMENVPERHFRKS